MIFNRLWIETYDPYTLKPLVLPNHTYNEPNVFFMVRYHFELANPMLRMTNAFTDFKCHVYVTPADAYTPYEKLLLPFDTETWILLLVTFAMTILIILIINRLSKRMQDVVYGRQIETPIWNVTSIFFGVSQTKLPTENFSRFILTLFIVFCLIFRTCFQSKSFEFMTSEPRRAPPKTQKDLIDRNYTMMVLNETEGDVYNTTRPQMYYMLILDKENW